MDKFGNYVQYKPIRKVVIVTVPCYSYRSMLKLGWSFKSKRIINRRQNL